jgi:Arc/MetJ family transcription regulator
MNLAIDEALLAEAMRLSGATTKTETLDLALREFVRHQRRELLRHSLGAFDLTYDLSELLRLRAQA